MVGFQARWSEPLVLPLAATFSREAVDHGNHLGCFCWLDEQRRSFTYWVDDSKLAIGRKAMEVSMRRVLVGEVLPLEPDICHCSAGLAGFGEAFFSLTNP